mmetsp:Transcript_96007/g.275636  ORF Transcript_96007/g.275636 Transcript_96007/m.275636 type:complete len:311 (+) Transcript_96007:40-972(+)
MLVSVALAPAALPALSRGPLAAGAARRFVGVCCARSGPVSAAVSPQASRLVPRRAPPWPWRVASGPPSACSRWPGSAPLAAPLGARCLAAAAGPVPPELEVRFAEHDAATRISHLPQWSQDEKTPPLSIRVVGTALLLPLVVGAAAVHLIAEGGSGEADADAVASTVAQVQAVEYSRTALSWTLHYAGALLSFAGAAHWGMQLAEFGVPRRSDYMALYYLSRFSAPVVFVFFGWLGSVLSTAEPREACLWLLCGYVGLLSFDFLACAFHIAPPWWFRWRAGFALSAIGCVLVLCLSERMLYLGQKPMIRM